MEKFEINDYFKKNYLTCGKTYDNFIFHNCPKDFLQVAYDNLSEEGLDVRPCLIKITREDEEKVEYTLKECSAEFQKLILSRDYVNGRVLKEIYSTVKEKGAAYAVLKEQVKAFNGGALWRVKQLHAYAPFISEMIEAYRKYGKFEINFFLEDTENVYIQNAINNFISSRTPFSVKIFTNLKHLPTYLDEGDTRIECPHDYLSEDVHNFINMKEDELPEI